MRRRNNWDNLTRPSQDEAPWGSDDAPVFIVLGQSNSYGHNTELPASEHITTGLKNVFTLSQAELYNTTFTSVSWKALTTFGDANIGTPVGSLMGNQNHPVNAANRFARLWQDHVTSGNQLLLPDLYVILMGWGSQGMSLEGTSGNNRWSPDRSETDVESLYPRALKTLRLAMNSLRAQGKNPRIIAIQWNQWETDTTTLSSAKASAMNFTRIITGINDALGTQDVPWRLFYPLASVCNLTNTSLVLKAINSVIAASPHHRTLIDTRTFPQYTGIAPNYGVFGTDGIHYHAATHCWFAQQEWDNVLAGYKGLQLPHISNSIDQYWLNKQVSSVISLPPTMVTSWYPNRSCEGPWLSATSLQLGLLFKNTNSISSAWDVVNVGGKKAFKPVTVSNSSTGGQCLAIASSMPVDAKYGYFQLDLFCNPFPEITLCFFAKVLPTGSYQNIGYGYMAIQLSGAYKGKPQWMPANVTSGAAEKTATPYVMVWDLSSPDIKSMHFSSKTPGGIYSGSPSMGYQYEGETLVPRWPTNSWSRWRIGLLAEENGTLDIEWYNTHTQQWEIVLQQKNMNAIMTGHLDSGQCGVMFGMSSTAKTIEDQNKLYSVAFKDIEFISLD
ncbi:TPA: hypothetical protein ACQ39K_004907 [Yersinia enterocolitica]